MKNNYDFILNFKTKDGEPLSEEDIEYILGRAKYVAYVISNRNNITVMKAILSQAVDSRRLET